MPETPRYLVIVRRGEKTLFEALQAQFGQGAAEVIWDRRIRDRRVIIQDVEASTERRRGERRAPLDATMWNDRGFIVARAGALRNGGAGAGPGRWATAWSRVAGVPVRGHTTGRPATGRPELPL